MNAIGAMTWPEAKSALDAAREAKDAYVRDVWDPQEAAQTMRQDHPVNVEYERLLDLECDAEEVMIAAPAPDLTAALFKIEHARERWAAFDAWPDAWWNSIIADLRRLSEPTPAAIQFDDALAIYRRLRAAELGMSAGLTLEEEERLTPAIDAALDATSAAFQTMLALPVSDASRIAAKLNAVVDFYDLGASGLDRAFWAQVVGETNVVLTGRAA